MAIKSWLIVAVVTVAAGILAGFGAAAAQGSLAAQAAPSNQRREINITRDSAPGWLPTRAQEQQVLAQTNNYFSALDSEQYQRAYAMMSDIERSAISLAQLIQVDHEFHDRAGPLIRRKILKVTWTKDPAAAPLPGAYAAVDVAAQFANVDRQCGYVVFYQAPGGGSFGLMRQESHFIYNATAEGIERQRSRAVLDALWADMARNCPNYLGAP